MIRLTGPWRWLWLSCALVACATVSPSGSELAGTEDEGVAVSFGEACEDESSLLALCAGNQCGLYRYREVMEHSAAGRVVLARGGVAVLLNPQPGAQRNWGSAQELPRDSRPVFIIPWRHKPPLLPSQQQMLDEAAKERRKPHEKHHIFPQMYKEWFTGRGIDIDEYVIPLAVEKHRSIHRGAKGGPWNAEWDKFIRAQLIPPPKEEIYRHAGKLIYEFELFGPVMPYWKQPPPLPLGY
ncbi:TIGR02269 family lipoprotein [Hyalangium minutum]|nr:TIGR02269 family lipoprotein [Hyalangium minutum]